MRQSKLRKAVLVADTEYSIALPANTRVLVMTSPSNFPIQASLVAGDVLMAWDPLNQILEKVWVIDVNTPVRVELDDVDGPLYFASPEPGPILDVEAWFR